MLANLWADAPAGWYAIEPGYVLKFTRIGEPLVLAITLGVLAVAAMLLVWRRPARQLLIGLAVLSVAFLGAIAAIGFRSAVDIELICKECHLVEWLTAALLMAAWLIGLAGLIGRRWVAGAKTLAVFLTAGMLAGWVRELEFGKPFFGNKVIYTRNLFRLEAYLNPAYFDEFGRKLGHETQRPLQVMHWVGAAVIFTFAIAVGSYLYRRRRVLARELKSFFATAAGRYFAVGCGLYIGTQLTGRVFELLTNLDNRLVGEPLECVASACFMVCMVSLWHAAARRAPRCPQPSQA